jgi:hypothetical protein
MVFAAVGALSGCGGQESSSTPTSYSQSVRTSANAAVLPSVEAEFINVVSTAQHNSPQAENDMQRGGLRATRDEAICRLLPSFNVENWIGTVTKIDSNSDGKGVMYISVAKNITLTTWNNDLSDIGDNTLIQPGTELFRTASSLKEGQKVLFSGSFIPTTEGCVNESSMTLKGKIDDPDFIFRFSSVAPYVPSLEMPKPHDIGARGFIEERRFPLADTQAIAAATSQSLSTQTALPAPQASAAPPENPESTELRARYDELAIRANAAIAGLSSFEQQQSRQGLRLRADIRETRVRMDYRMQEIIPSLRNGDMEGARRNLQYAQNAVETIEKFLGR